MEDVSLCNIKHNPVINMIKTAHASVLKPMPLACLPTSTIQTVREELAAIGKLPNIEGFVKAISTVICNDTSKEVWQMLYQQLVRHQMASPTDSYARTALTFSADSARWVKRVKGWASNSKRYKAQIYWVKFLPLFPFKRLYFQALLTNHGELYRALSDLHRLMQESLYEVSYSERFNHVQLVAESLTRVMHIVEPELSDPKWNAARYLMEQIFKARLEQSTIEQILNKTYHLCQVHSQPRIPRSTLLRWKKRWERRSLSDIAQSENREAQVVSQTGSNTGSGQGVSPAVVQIANNDSSAPSSPETLNIPVKDWLLRNWFDEQGSVCYIAAPYFHVRLEDKMNILDKAAFLETCMQLVKDHMLPTDPNSGFHAMYYLQESVQCDPSLAQDPRVQAIHRTLKQHLGIAIIPENIAEQTPFDFKERTVHDISFTSPVVLWNEPKYGISASITYDIDRSCSTLVQDFKKAFISELVEKVQDTLEDAYVALMVQICMGIKHSMQDKRADIAIDCMLNGLDPAIRKLVENAL